MKMQGSCRFLFKKGHASSGISETPAGVLRQIKESVKEGSKKEERDSSTGKQDVPGCRGGIIFFSLTSVLLTATGFLVSSGPQQTALVPKDSAHDCLSEKLHDGCTGQTLSRWMDISNPKIAAGKQSGTAADGEQKSISYTHLFLQYRDELLSCASEFVCSTFRKFVIFLYIIF